MSKNLLPYLIGLLLLSSAVVLFAQEEQEDLLASGISLYERGEYQAAIPVFRSAYLQLEKGKEKAQQAKAQYYLAQAYLYTGQTQEATKTYRKTYQLAKRYGPMDILFLTTDALGEILMMQGLHQQAIPVLLNRLSLARQLEDFNALTMTQSSLGINYLRIGQLDSARWYMERGLAIKRERGDTLNLDMHYNHLGSFYQEIGDYDQAFHFHLLSLKELEKSNKRPQIVIAYTNIAEILFHQDNLARAEEYNQQAIVLGRAENLVSWLGVAFFNMGTIRQKQKKYDEALTYFESALGQFQKSQTGSVDYKVLSTIGLLYLRKGQYEIAEQYLREGLELAYQKNKKRDIIDISLDLGGLKIKTRQLPEARFFLDEALRQLADFNRPKSLAYYYEVEVKYQEALGDYQKALAAFQQQQYHAQSQYDLAQNEKINELEQRYERMKKDREISTLNAENELQDVRIRQSRRNTLLATIGLLFAAALIVFLYFYNRTKRLANQKLAEKNVLISKSLGEKEILLREIHHRVKNNLQVISSLLRLQTRYIKSEKALGALEEGRNRVKSMAMIHQDLYREGNLTGIKASDYIQKLSDSLFNSYNIDPQRIQLRTDIDDLNIDVDTIIPLGLILNELLTNALKYAFQSEEKGEVKVRLKQESEHLLLEVCDDGWRKNKNDDSAKEQVGFGMKLIETFAEKLHAELEVQRAGGTAIRLLIKKYKLI